MEVLKVGVQPFCPTFVQSKLHFPNYKMTFLGMLDKMENVFCPTFCPSVGQNTPPQKGGGVFCPTVQCPMKREKKK